MTTKFKITTENKGIYSWDTTYKVQIEDGPLRGIYFYIQGLVSGCGAVVIGRSDEIASTLKNAPTKDKEDGIASFKYVVTELLKRGRPAIVAGDSSAYGLTRAGTVLATLGGSSMSYESTLESMGFKKIDEYENNQHSAGYKQRLYGLHI